MLIVGAYVWKLRREERVLTAELGEAYTAYREEVPALVPFAHSGRAGQTDAAIAGVCRHATLRSERFRVMGILAFVLGFIVLNISRLLSAHDTASDIAREIEYLTFWAVIGGYELVMLWGTTRAMRGKECEGLGVGHQYGGGVLLSDDRGAWADGG